MDDVRMPKAVFFSGLQEGKRDRDASRKCYKDQLKRRLAQAGDQTSVMEVGHLRPETSALISEKGQSYVRGRKARSCEGQTQEAERASSLQIMLSQGLLLSRVE